jgi:hypothetical protein
LVYKVWLIGSCMGLQHVVEGGPEQGSSIANGYAGNEVRHTVEIISYDRHISHLSSCHVKISIT